MLKNVLSASLLTTCLTFSFVASAQNDEFANAASDLCETIKSCALDQMGASQMTPEMKQAMGPMLDGMCKGILASVGSFPADHKLYKPATACMRSMEKQGCALVNSGGKSGETPECKEYETLAKKYGDAQS